MQISYCGINVSMNKLVFPGGELHLTADLSPISEIVPTRVPGMEESSVVVTQRIQSSDDLMELIIGTPIIKRQLSHCNVRIELVIPYFPYARQDRITDSHGAFSLKTAANLINELKYSEVTAFDPHSDITKALVDNFNAVSATDIIRRFQSLQDTLKSKTLVAPDAGAYKKVANLSQDLRVPFIAASKKRDPVTGKLSGFSVPDGVPEEVLIVDDICDGGGTFVGLAQELRKKGAKKIDLYVTHGIFSKGLDPFKGLIDNIFTTNTFLSPTIIAGADNLYVKAVV